MAPFFLFSVVLRGGGDRDERNFKGPSGRRPGNIEAAGAAGPVPDRPGDDTGLNKNTIGAMERGESDFGISKLISVCEALQASPNDLLPDRLSRNDTLSSDMQKLQDRLSQLSPYQRAQCMTMINAILDGVTNILS